MAVNQSLHEYKVFNLNKLMNFWSDSGRKCALEAESKPGIVGKHLHYKDMSN